MKSELYQKMVLAPLKVAHPQTSESTSQYGLVKTFMVFNCGHKFHKKCIASKRQI